MVRAEQAAKERERIARQQKAAENRKAKAGAKARKLSARAPVPRAAAAATPTTTPVVQASATTSSAGVAKRPAATEPEGGDGAQRRKMMWEDLGDKDWKYLRRVFDELVKPEDMEGLSLHTFRSLAFTRVSKKLSDGGMDGDRLKAFRTGAMQLAAKMFMGP